MELALNLVWVCVAIVGIGLLYRSLSSAEACPERPSGNWQKIVAMGCALVILFFVISMTDDLHDQEILVEENKSLRIVPATGIFATSIPSHMFSGVFLVECDLASSAPTLPSARKPIDLPKVITPAAIVIDRLHGRAPPTSLA